MQEGTLLAAVDLGSNSFRLEIGRLRGGHVERVDYIKESVRLGSGLDAHRHLTQAAMAAGLACLARFGERLRGFDRSHVRAVATQTLREARNRDDFIQQGQALLGFPINVVPGLEEARLIYQGVAHLLPQSDERRLVVDVGGRSTEMILGVGYEARVLQSHRVGSVAWTDRYFPDGQLGASMFRDATLAAQAVLDEALDDFPRTAWDVAYGASGTVNAIADVLRAQGRSEGAITRDDLAWITDRMCRAKHIDAVALEGIKPERRPVMGGGVAVLSAIMELFDVERLEPAQGALRHGTLYDLLERDDKVADTRERTVLALQKRFAVDRSQARRVCRVAEAIFEQVAAPNTRNERSSHKLRWAAMLHEIGTHISHVGSPQHGAYLLDNVDAPGFSLDELHRMSLLVLGQRGKLRRIEAALTDELFAKQVFALRVAVLLCHSRRDPELRAVKASYAPGGFKLCGTQAWADAHPQSAWMLHEEQRNWQKTSWRFTLKLG